MAAPPLSSASTRQVRVGLGVFVWRDGKFIMGQRLGAHGANTWSIPGGHLEFGESWEACAKREVREETGMIVDNVRFVATTNDKFAKEGRQYVTIWVECDWVSGEAELTEPDKFVAQQWRNFRSLPTPLFEPCWTNLRAARPDLFA